MMMMHSSTAAPSHSMILSAASIAAAAIQQSSNSGIKLLTLTKFRYDPYSAPVIPYECITQSPVRQMNAYRSTSSASSSCSSSFNAGMSDTASVGYYADHMYDASSVATVLPRMHDEVVSFMPAVHVQPNILTAAPYPSHSSTLAAMAPLASPIKLAPAPSIHGVRYVIVKFKQETATFIAPFRVVVGETVVVQGDRGENIGVVQEVSQAVPSFDVPHEIIRKATDKDMSTLRAQREREAAARQFTQTLATSLGLHATIEDAEYQFDLNKLTIFVRRSAKGGFVDFRKLQRSLFREFRCRIWCSYMDEVEAVENGPRSR